LNIGANITRAGCNIAYKKFQSLFIIRFPPHAVTSIVVV
jgi:hypothetical protein